MYQLSNLEIHAWHGCNLTCESCSHFSSLGLRSGPTAEECDRWMRPWASRLKPQVFSIVGGEPTLNKQLAEIVYCAGITWPESIIRLVTNGFLLPKHPQLIGVLSDLSDRAVLEISSHHNSPQYQARFEGIRQLANQWKESHHIDIRIIDATQRWTRRYISVGSSVEFIGSNPRIAWEICEGKSCKQIFRGNLWKCPPIAYFSLLRGKSVVSKHSSELAESYVALTPGCSDLELRQFLAKEDESVCQLCPSSLEFFDLPNPLTPPAKRTRTTEPNRSI